MYAAIFADPTRVIELDKNFNKLALETMYLRRQENASNVAETIHKFYFGDNHIDNEAVSEVTNVSTTGGQRWPTVLICDILNKQMHYFARVQITRTKQSCS
jgi:hypothetical protein